MSEQKRWYVIHTYSGYEKKVTTTLERKIHSLGMEDEVFQVLMPMQEEVEINDDKKKLVQRKVFPGYVLVEMIVTDRSWYVVRNTPGVTGFVGSGSKPIPLTDAEVEQILGKVNRGENEKPKERHVIDVMVQQAVKLTSGSFAGKVGTVAEINEERGKLKVLVEMFGRQTPVEVDFSQVEKM